MKKAPNDNELLALRGTLRHRQRNFQAAVEDFQAALTVDPKQPAWLNALGKSLNNLQRIQPAESAFRRSLELDAGNAEAWHNLGFTLRAQGLHHEAADAFSEAARIKPDYVSAWHNEGLAYLAMDDPERALELFRIAQELDPKTPRLATHIGVALHTLGRFDDAVRAYHEALGLEHNAETQNNLAVSLQELGRDKEALAAYREAARLAPSDPEIPVKIADLLIGMGEPQKALDIARQCLSNFPGQTGALAVEAVAGQEPGCEIPNPRLLDFEKLIYRGEVSIPDTFESLESFNDTLATHILEHPTLVFEPAGHATRHGSHTGNLLAGNKGPLAVIEQEISAGVNRFVESLHPQKTAFLLSARPARWQLTMWAVVMDAQGHQLPHIHPAAWLSGVYYVQVPGEIAADDKSRGGWIEFGAPPESMNCRGRHRLQIFRPVAGNFFIFPGYLYHRTIPFTSSQKRICVAFDVIEAQQSGS